MSNDTQIKDLTKLTLFFGRLSSVHIENLKAFPFIFFNGVKQVNLKHDIDTANGASSSITYDLILDGENDQLQKRFLALENAVCNIFWKELMVKLSINGQEFKNE